MSSVATAASGSRKPRILRAGIAKLSDLQDYASPVPDLFLDTKVGSNSNDGLSWDSALATMAVALAKAQTGNRIFFRGDVREEIVGSNLKFDIKIIGVGGLHHPDEPSSAYHPGSATWRAPASPTTATPLLKVRGRGWEFHNIMFDVPVDAAALLLENNGESGTSEYDASHAIISNCVFQQGKYGIQLSGPIGHVLVQDTDFAILNASGGCAIFAATDGGPNYRWKIERNYFVAAATAEGNQGNQSHIDVALFSSLIADNFFGTVESTGLYIDLTGGQDNIVTRNLLMGAYNTSDYVAGTGDSWAGNQSLSASFGGNSAQGTTLTAPASAT